MAQTKTRRKTTGKTRTSSKSMKKAQDGRSVRSSRSKRAETASRQAASDEDEEVTIDRRRTDRRGETQQSDAPSPETPQLERRQKVNRRRQIDPTTCERDYTEQEVEFMNALDDYKRKSGRMFPTCSEVLEVLRGLGYMKLSPAELAVRPEASAGAASAKPMPVDWPQSTLEEISPDIDSSDLERKPEWAC